MKNLSPEQQFEIEASTMSRDQLYDLAKKQALRIVELEITLAGALELIALTDEQERNWDLIKAQIKR
jgi:hypothetical protein